MKKRFTEEQIIGFLREAEAGMPVAELCRKHAFSEASYYLWRSKFGGGSIDQLVNQVSLYALEDYLKSSPKIAVMHNADDLILGPGDLGFLRRTFGERLTVYPHGGHCGNLNYRVNSDAMLEFFRG
mgnify:CR=1 FL=1